MDKPATPAQTLRAVFVANVDWYFLMHRMPLAREMRRRGYEVSVVAGPSGEAWKRIQAEGFQYIPWTLERRSMNPFKELRAAYDLVRIYRLVKPDLVHHFTLKTVLYGSFAALCTHVPRIVDTLPGMGWLYLGTDPRRRFLRRVVQMASWLGLAWERVTVIFENPDDLAVAVRMGIVRESQARVVRGAGVSLAEFPVRPEPEHAIPVVLYGGRLLWDKGLKELMEAARLLHEREVPCRIVIAGAPDSGNPNSIDRRILEEWRADGHVELWGERSDMPDVLAAANIVVLPSYAEGLPRILLEAAATGRALVATNVRGCREIVIHGRTGLLVPPRDAPALAAAIEEILGDPTRRRQMGREGRELIEREFSEDKVIADTLAVYGEPAPG